MNGEVDESGRALVVLKVHSTDADSPSELTVWIDTAFTGELVIPREKINELGLSQSAAVMAGLADGTEVVLETYSCDIDWFGEERHVEVIENDGKFPLLGIGLLEGYRLEIDYRSRTLIID